MKILKIEAGCGHFRKEANGPWSQIDQINKNDLLKLLNLFLEGDVEMDNPSDHELHNEVHKIVYTNIFEKLGSLSESKSAFKDESERKYLSEINKYSAA
ncbi:MAG: hypothetical protein ABJM29_00400 [Rhizobiaceae bacterium]